MNKEKNLSQTIKKGFFKTALWLLLGFFFTLTITLAAFQFPFFQTKLVNYISATLSERVDHKITIDYVIIDWFDQISIQGLQVNENSGKPTISAKKLWIDFSIRELFSKELIVIDEVISDELVLYLDRPPGETEFGFDKLVRNLRMMGREKDTSQTGRKAIPFTIHKISLNNSSFGIYNRGAPQITEGFDYHRFRLDHIIAEVDSFYVYRDSIYMDIKDLSTVDSLTSLQVHDLDTKLMITSNKMYFHRLHALIGNSTLNDSLVFSYENFLSFQDFNNQVRMDAHFNDALINSHDLALFAPQLKAYDDVIRIKGHFNGYVSNFSVKNSEIQFGNSSQLKGNISLDGLPYVKETFINLNLDYANFKAEDLRQYIADSSIYMTTTRLGDVSFSGQFIGFGNDFVANGIFRTDLGRFESDINLKLDGPENSSYSGSFSAFNFDVGQLIGNDSLLQKVQISGNVNGSGFTLESIETDIDVRVEFIGILGYTYQNIKTKASLASSYFEGRAAINDPNFKFDGEASIDLRNNRNLVKIKASLDTIPLHLLNIVKEESFVKLELDADFKGLHPDSIVGDIRIQDFYGYYNQQSIELDTISLFTGMENNIRTIDIRTQLADARLEGDYLLSRFINNVAEMGVEFALNILNDSDRLQQYYDNKEIDQKDSIPYFVNYEIKIKDTKPIFDLFVPELYLQQNQPIYGSFMGGLVPVFNLYTQIDTLKYKQYQFYESQLDFSISKLIDTTQMLSAIYLFSENQAIGTTAKTKNLELDVVWSAKKLNFNTHIEETKDLLVADIIGQVTFDKNQTHIKLDSSTIGSMERQWHFLDDNEILLEGGEISISKLGIVQANQSIKIDGFISDSANKELKINIVDLDVDNVNSLIAKNYFGKTDANISLRDLYGQKIIEGDFFMKSLIIDDFLLGDINGKSNWQSDQKSLALNFNINRLGKEIIVVDGDIRPGDKTNQLDLNAKFSDANLDIAEPFINDIFSRLAGTITGDFQISGLMNYPVLKGKANINGGEARINYLNTLYSINGDVLFNQDEIIFDKVRLLDANNSEGLLNGSIRHQGFSQIYIDLFVDARNFRVLNTIAKDNTYFYGMANVTGKTHIYGEPSNMYINAAVRSEKGTRISIPVVSTNTIEQEEYITFIYPDDSSRVIDVTEELEKIALKGLTLNFDLDLTPDAYAEIIFDLRAGDIIRGRGNGKLSLQIDSNGEFLMFGDYELTEGAYNFTLYDVINKEFNINPGSRISWFGDPYEGQLDIKATYEQNVSIIPLLVNADTTVTSNNLVRRRYPSKVILRLTDNLLQPQFDFDIELTGYPESVNGYPIGGEIQAFKTEIMADEQELNKQVFSLILMRRFQQRASVIDMAGSVSVGNSVSELLSNQLSNWLSQVDDNFEIELDIGSMDQDAFNTFQMRMSYTFMEGRLRVSRDGNMSGQSPDQSAEAEVLGIIGDWTVEYLLSPDGKLRVRMYNRTNVNPYTSAVGVGGGGFNNQTTTSAGVSLLHVQSFNQIKEIFDLKRNKRKENIYRDPEEEIKPEEDPQDGSHNDDENEQIGENNLKLKKKTARK